MEELIKIAYVNFLNECDATNSKEIRIINKSWTPIEKEFDHLHEILNEKLFDGIYEKLRDGVADVQESAFIAGFAYCAKFLTNGKTDLFPNI